MYTKEEKNRTKIIEVSVFDTFSIRKKLMNVSYKEYLKSKEWGQIKEKIKKRKRFKKCAFCNDTKIELHHKTYKWVGTKHELKALIPVCRKHHQEIHDLANKEKISIRIATNIIVKKYPPNKIE